MGDSSLIFCIMRGFSVSGELGITEDIYRADRKAFQQYLYYGSNSARAPSDTLLRQSYPTASSRVSDPIIPSPDPFAAAGFLTREVADESSVRVNWNWMLNYGQDPHDGSTGYFLRAWARSEAAKLRACEDGEH
jgi:hypothetical protein